MSSAVVALSGGQDSATCLFWAQREFDRVLAVTFDYWQTHAVELKAAKELAHMAQVPWTLLDIGPAFGQIAETTLTSDDPEAQNHYAAAHGLPASFVPGRNLILLSYAAAFAAVRGIDNVVTGVCEQDAAGYPDCRQEFVEALEPAVNSALGLDGTIYFHTPLMYRSKAKTWQLAADLGVLNRVRFFSHTCYRGDRETWFPWGFGCGGCTACETRAAGWAEFKGLSRA